LFEGLRDFGYAEAPNLIVERRYAGDRTERFDEFAAEMVRSGVDIIVVVTFQKGLTEVGYSEGRNIEIESPWAEGQFDRLPAMANELVK